MLRLVAMSRVHDGLAGIDLNLVLALDALLAERHVTRAATRLGITQSAASHALARLRDVLGDPLLVRGTRASMIPTPRAEQLAPAIHKVLADLAGALRGDDVFDPATAKRTFRIGAIDYVELVLMRPLIERVARIAPGIDFWVHNFAGGVDEVLETAAVDLVLVPSRTTTGARLTHAYEKVLFDEGFTCVMRAGHPLAGQRLTLARYCSAAHVLVAPRGTPGSLVDTALAAEGRSRRIALALPHFLAVPHIVAGSDLIATLASRVASQFAGLLDLVTAPPPFPMPKFQISLAWHERFQHDAAHRWLRDQIVAVSKDLS